MVNILDKISTLRFATATAQLKVSSEETIKAILEKRIPKGDVFEFSRAAGLLAVKKTSDVIPDCHPLPIEYTHIRHEIDNLNIHIYVEAATIYKTGLEVEAMHGASIVALTMYDMLKPIDKNIEISSIKLLNKKGGKSSFQDKMTRAIKTAVVVCSDSVSAGKKEDKAGKAIISLLEKSTIHTSHYSIIPDEKIAIQSTVKKLVDEHFDLILFTGGTGLSPRDITPESIAELIEREIPGIMEVARNYGQQRTPYAMLSRGIAGFIGNALVITLPGSTNGAKESMQALFPYLKHIFKVIEGIRHD